MHSDEHGQPSKAASRKLEALEAEISRLKKQRAQQQALMSARQKSDARVKQLEGEIGAIRAQKVELTRRQREEAEAHRAQRIARENELKQMRRREGKQAAALAKLEGEHAKQAQVLKRKNEEIEKLANAQKKQRAAEHGPNAAVRRNTITGSGIGSGMGFGSFGPPGGPPPLSDRPSSSTARKPAGGGVAGMTSSQQAKIEGRKEHDLQKAVSAMGAKPREWLDGELKVAH